MENTTRAAFDLYVSRIAELNGVSSDYVRKKFTVEPSLQQKLESKIQESSAFLKSINFYSVLEQEGEKIGMTVGSAIASTTDTNSQSRKTKDVLALDNNKYRCEQTNYDTHIRYATLDQWAKFKDFQVRLTNLITQNIALNRMMIGFNGTSRADTSDFEANPLLQDVNIGWLEKIRTKAAQRWMKEVAEESGVINIGDDGDYQNLDALVYDMVHKMIEPWYQNDPKLVVITGRRLMADKYFPLVNANHDPSETLAADMIISQRRIGNLPAVTVPFFPESSIMVTRLDNLSMYTQAGKQRRSVIDRAERDRIETYQSSNDAFELEDYGCAALAENIVMLPPKKKAED